ncbi:uncharacterized protein GBIM_08212 [Gryllus bimaculatus]|nr:uncharacterized protein GBIM_08212 [Gryllus bimaculatus]
MFSETVPVVEVQGVLGKLTLLPCDIVPTNEEDAVHMVLWFKEADGEPLYRGRHRPPWSPAVDDDLT